MGYGLRPLVPHRGNPSRIFWGVISTGGPPGGPEWAGSGTVLLVDDDYAQVGSANLDPRSLRLRDSELDGIAVLEELILGDPLPAPRPVGRVGAVELEVEDGGLDRGVGLELLLVLDALASYAQGETASARTALERALALGYGTLALTDRDNLYLAIRFYQRARAEGLTPLAYMRQYGAFEVRRGAQAEYDRIAAGFKSGVASQADLERCQSALELALIEAGRFRQDLLFRMGAFEISVPPLRERPEDIGPLVERFRALARLREGMREERQSSRP